MERGERRCVDKKAASSKRDESAWSRRAEEGILPNEVPFVRYQTLSPHMIRDRRQPACTKHNRRPQKMEPQPTLQQSDINVGQMIGRATVGRPCDKRQTLPNRAWGPVFMPGKKDTTLIHCSSSTSLKAMAKIDLPRGWSSERLRRHL